MRPYNNWSHIPHSCNHFSPNDFKKKLSPSLSLYQPSLSLCHFLSLSLNRTCGVVLSLLSLGTAGSLSLHLLLPVCFSHLLSLFCINASPLSLSLLTSLSLSLSLSLSSHPLSVSLSDIEGGDKCILILDQYLESQLNQLLRNEGFDKQATIDLWNCVRHSKTASIAVKSTVRNLHEHQMCEEYGCSVNENGERYCQKDLLTPFLPLYSNAEEFEEESA